MQHDVKRHGAVTPDLFRLFQLDCGRQIIREFLFEFIEQFLRVLLRAGGGLLHRFGKIGHRNVDHHVAAPIRFEKDLLLDVETARSQQAQNRYEYRRKTIFSVHIYPMSGIVLGTATRAPGSSHDAPSEAKSSAPPRSLLRSSHRSSAIRLSDSACDSSPPER